MEYVTNQMFDISRLDKRLEISTICFTFKLNTTIYLDEMRKYMKYQINPIGLLEIKTNYNEIYTLLKKKKPKTSTNFYNSIQLVLRMGSNKKINMKIFHNGAVQSSGCKSPNECNIAIDMLINLLNTIITLPDGCISRYIKDEIVISSIQIDMINTNFKCDFLENAYINRDKLYELLLRLKIFCQYEKCNHAGVHIEHNPTNKKKPNHIIVFEKKSILITASKNEDHIMESFNFITDILIKYKLDIIKFPEELIFELLNTPKYEKYSTF